MRSKRTRRKRIAIADLDSGFTPQSTGGNVVNQIQRDFNGLGQIITEYQSHSGAVNTGTSPKVQYTYSEMAGGANHSRLTSLIYPDGFAVGYNYASGLDNVISRLTSMTNSSTTLEGFAYLGLGTVVERAHPETDVNLTYIGGGTGEAGDKYTGLDRFGRIIDQWWRTPGGRTIERFKYGYDRNSNRLYRTNESNTTFSELYHADGAANGYDGLNQLSEFQRGTLSDTNSDGIPDTVSSAARYQTWDSDALGNFEGVNTDGTNQSRTHNKQNQSTVVGGNNLTFDDNGNMTTDETGRTISFDAWNRLVKINGTTRYANDALGRRIKEGSTDLYYSTNWQVLEENVGGNVESRNVWSPVYVDAMVLRDRDTEWRTIGLEERLYVTHDANFNVTSVIDTGATILERFVYDPYGRFDFKDGSYGARGSSSYAWVYLHQGGRFDAGAGLFHFRNRDYSPTLMRWASVDPIGFRAGDGNLYRYEKPNPLSRLDPTGLFAYLRCGAVFTPWLKHCTIFLECEGVYLQIDGGGRIPGNPQQNPRPSIGVVRGSPPAPGAGEDQWELESPFCSCMEELKCLLKAFAESLPQPPYSEPGPNSNTFAHGVLKRCNIKFSPWNYADLPGNLPLIPSGAIGWEMLVPK